MSLPFRQMADFSRQRSQRYISNLVCGDGGRLSFIYCKSMAILDLRSRRVKLGFSLFQKQAGRK